MAAGTHCSLFGGKDRPVHYYETSLFEAAKRLTYTDLKCHYFHASSNRPGLGLSINGKGMIEGKM